MIHIRPFAATDLPLGQRLSRLAGWNQTEADWQRLFDLQPDGGFVAEWSGATVGTILTTCFGPVAWISMLLVDEVVRGRGVGKALMNRALEFLDRQGVSTIRLDATPMGQPLYDRMGFVEQFRLARFEGTLPAIPATACAASVSHADWDGPIALDKLVTGTDRRRLLLRLFREQPDNNRCVWNNGRLAGYLASRPGARATFLGPACAGADAGLLLLQDAWQRHAGARVIMDVPYANEPALRFVQSMGLKIQRSFSRMVRGVVVMEQQDSLWASAGPEKG